MELETSSLKKQISLRIQIQAAKNLTAKELETGSPKKQISLKPQIQAAKRLKLRLLKKRQLLTLNFIQR